MKLEATRQGLTKKVSACGMKFYVTVNFADNHPAEVFVVIAKNGSVISGLVDCWCISTSTCLRLGAKWDDLREKFIHQRFDPMDDSNPSIIHAITVTIDELIEERIKNFGN